MMAATPLSKQSNPKAFVNWAMPKISTRTIDVNAMNAAVNVKMSLIAYSERIGVHSQENRPKTEATMQKLA